MTGTGWQQLWVRILTTALTIAVMVLIFCFSMETAEQSDHTSGWISRTIIKIIDPDYDRKTAEEQIEIYDSVQHAVRKTAHFTEYALLGLMIRFCIESWTGTRKWSIPLAWISGTLYAVTDEIHQLMISGRSGQWTDVAIDSCGAALGAAAAALIIILISRRAERHSGKEA